MPLRLRLRDGLTRVLVVARDGAREPRRVARPLHRPRSCMWPGSTNLRSGYMYRGRRMAQGAAANNNKGGEILPRAAGEVSMFDSYALVLKSRLFYVFDRSRLRLSS